MPALAKWMLFGFAYLSTSLAAFASEGPFSREELLRAREKSQPKSMVNGIVSSDGSFVVSASVWGSDAETLAEKLAYPGVAEQANPRFSVSLLGNLRTNTIFEVISGGMKASSNPSGVEVIRSLTVYLPDSHSEYGKGIPLRWANEEDSQSTLEAQAQVPLPMIEGRESLTLWLETIGDFKTLQQGQEAERLLNLILSPSVPIVNLRNRHRVRDLYWQPELKRLIRIDEPPSRTFWDYVTIDAWASRLAVQVWKVQSSPLVFSHARTLLAKRIKGTDVDLPLNDSVYPEPEALTIQLSETEKVLLPWFSSSIQDLEAKGANPVLIQNIKSGYKAYPLQRLTMGSVHPNYWRAAIDVNESGVAPKLKQQPLGSLDFKSDESFCEFLTRLIPPQQ